MATVSVRVKPGSTRTGVDATPAGLIVRVRAAPEAGRATEEARRALADALGVARSRIRLRSGATSRRKVFEVDGLSDADVRMLLRATPSD
jgi:hypothetical protein